MLKTPSRCLCDILVTGADAIPSRTRLSRFDATSSEYTS